MRVASVVQEELQDDAGGNGHQHIVTAHLNPVVAAWRSTEAVPAPIVDHIAAAAVFRRQAVAAIVAMIRASATFASMRIAALAVLVRVTAPAVPMRVASPSLLLEAALALPVSIALREGGADLVRVRDAASNAAIIGL